MVLHTNKRGLRVLGVAESFRKNGQSSTLAGVVMRGDFLVDGIVLGKSSVGGDDATSSIASLHRRLRRDDVGLILVSGAILSFYNIVDADLLSSKSKLPVICLTYKETSGIEGSIRRRFPDAAEPKLLAYGRLGERIKVKLATGSTVYVRLSGVDPATAKKVLDIFTLQGSVPEPIKVAKLVARAAMARRS